MTILFFHPVNGVSQDSLWTFLCLRQYRLWRGFILKTETNFSAQIPNPVSRERIACQRVTWSIFPPFVSVKLHFLKVIADNLHRNIPNMTQQKFDVLIHAEILIRKMAFAICMNCFETDKQADGSTERCRGWEDGVSSLVRCSIWAHFDVTVITNWLAYKYSSIDIANMETIINSLWRWREGTCAWFQRRRTTASSSPPRARRHRYALVGLWMKYAMTAPSDWAPRPSANSPTSRFSPPPGNTHTLIQHSLQHKKSFALASSPINSSFLSFFTHPRRC